MPICERCSVTFASSPDLAEVTSLRVLCPECMQEHRARREPRAPASVPGARTPADEARPGPRTRVAVEAPAARVASPRHAAGDATRPAKPKPAAKPAKRLDPSALQSHSLQKRGNREILLGFGGAVLVLAVAGLVLYNVLGRKNAEAAEQRAREERIEGFRTAFLALDLATEEGAKQLIAFAEENEALWTEAAFASDVVGRTAKAKTFLEGLEQKRTLEQRLGDVESVLARAAELSPGEFADQRRRLDELAAQGAVVGAEFVARIAKDRDEAERAYLERLETLAREAAASPELDRAALATIQQAEDEILKAYEASYRVWQKSEKDEAVTARKNELEERYKAAVALSDEAVERFFTPEVVDAMPWRDLLAPGEVSSWKGAALKGFEYRIADGVLHLIGPDPAEKSEGVISIGDKEVWRDYVLDAEITLERGACSFFFRLPPVWQENVEQYDFTTDEGDLEAGRSYAYSFRLIGSSLTDERHDEESLGPTVKKISWTRVRKGALGISVPKDTEVRFTRLRVKLLR